MSRIYRVHEFAELAGVTVKALHPYDRLGLLQPRRTDGGYRIYLDRDLERLEQIIALKFLGLPLQQIKAVLDHPDLELPDTLRLQREALEEKREHLNRAIRAIRAAEEAIGPGKTTDPAMLKRIIQVIDMQTDIDQMKKYYSTEGEWEKRRRYYEEGPSREWKELYRDIDAALGEEPGGDIAQGLADRWLALGIKAYSGDTDQQTDSITAWMDRAHWPPAVRDRVAEFNLEKVHAFMREVAICSKKKYFSDQVWIRMQSLRNRDSGAYSVLWQMRVDLFRDIESCLDEDPGSD